MAGRIRSGKAARDGRSKRNTNDASIRFEAAKVDALFPVLDAIAWMDLPVLSAISQFAGIDARTAGKLLKNCIVLNLVEEAGSKGYNLRVPYPAKGSAEEKEAVVREALVRLPLLASYHQFRALGDPTSVALRKAATVQGIGQYEPRNLTPLLDWAKRFDILETTPKIEDLVEEATREKEARHRAASSERVVFISHSSKDKKLVRRLVSDLTSAGVKVWLDEQGVIVGDSISEKISQALARSDLFVIALSKHSNESDWVQRELNAAIMGELSRRSVRILPIRLDDADVPPLLADRKYADFAQSYQEGLRQLLEAINAKSVENK